MTKPYFLYILKCADASLYTGITNDIERRFAAHASGVGANYTRSHKPLQIVYTEECKTRGAALRREAEVKRLRRPEKIALIKARSQAL